MSSRVDNWQIAFAEEISKPRVFQWGINDCCLFACDVVKILTNIDPADTFRGKYSTALGAYKELKKQGFSGVLDVANKRFAQNNWHQVSLALAQRGDVACAFFERQHTLGVVTGENAIFVGDNGYVNLPVQDCVRSWRIG
tara:strand:+ start:495 stop:914 length:420 start_codon:yes stop_codon:yes gene_type:complete